MWLRSGFRVRVWVRIKVRVRVNARVRNNVKVMVRVRIKIRIRVKVRVRVRIMVFDAKYNECVSTTTDHLNVGFGLVIMPIVRDPTVHMVAVTADGECK